MKGHPILGAVFGLTFGLFLALVLQQWGVYPLTTLSVIGLPVLGLMIGLLLAAWAPLGKGPGPSTPAVDGPTASNGTPPSPSPEDPFAPPPG
jgi:hypothetical protein